MIQRLVIVALILLAILGTPLFAIIGASALWNFHGVEADLQIVPIGFWALVETPVLLAIPLFTLAGYLLSESGAPQRLVRVTQAAFGWMPAGLAIVALFTCAFFTAFTGGSGVTIIALGALLFPALKQAGVVDAGGQGFVDLLEGMASFVAEGTLDDLSQNMSDLASVEFDTDLEIGEHRCPGRIGRGANQNFTRLQGGDVLEHLQDPGRTFNHAG